jgi:hypothetical protein
MSLAGGKKLNYKEKKQFFESKQQRKLEAYQRLAQKAEQEAEQRRQSAEKLMDAIPFGQPILVGHHSEKMHRRHLEKINYDMNKSFELQDKAKHYENKVNNLKNPYAISSDDPDAIKLLKEKIAAKEQEHAFWKAKIPNQNAKSCFDEDSAHWRNIQMASIKAEIRRLKKRVDELHAIEKMEDIDKEVNGVHVFTDKLENRLKIIFPSIPSKEIRDFLKSRGFHWSPYNKAWQRMISEAAIYNAEELLRMV